MTSVIIPCIYRPDLTKTCIDSVLAYSKDYEIILVHEGDDQEIGDLLRGYADQWSYKVKYVQNKVAKGFPGAMNTGLALAKGEYICFLNSDTVVTPNWLEKMLRGFNDPQVGLVAPTLPGILNRQSVDWNLRKTDENYREFEYLLGEHASFAVIGVCFLIPKKVLDKIGSFDESFCDDGAKGGGEDYDLTYRINKEYLLAIARDVYIYHYQGASFKEIFKDLGEARENAARQFAKLEKKHNIQIL